MRPERILLIHGAWAGPWVWDGLIEELSSLGWRAEALALPGDGTHPIPPEQVTQDDYLTCLSNAILAEPGPVALVGHSGGGMLVTLWADTFPDRVSHGIWLAGMLIADGRSFDDIQRSVTGHEDGFGVTPHIVPSDDGYSSCVPQDAAIAHFFHDAPPDIAKQAAARLTPQPNAGHRLRVTAGDGFAALRKLYVLATEDRSVLPEAQDLMARSVPNVDCVRIATGHAPQLTRAKDLADLMSRWLTGTP
jgi:pimeloyl-ACP methyl ester carboxylesterase